MLLYLFITLPFVLIAALVYSSRNGVLGVSRWMLRRRYEITLTGLEALDPRETYLVIPNHPAIVDPFLVVTELHAARIDLRPLVDESFFSNRIARHILALMDAVKVPDFQRLNFRPILKARPKLHDAARRAKALGYTVLATLTSGGNVILYPSGHITADGRELIKNRQLAYNVISQLPEKVRVLGVRTRGLYGSMWSRKGGRPAPPFASTLAKALAKWFFCGFWAKRPVTIHFEDLTGACEKWLVDGRMDFNRHLEQWYDADLTARGGTCEEMT